MDRHAWNRTALLTCDQMRRAELAACENGRASFSLMQQAGQAVAQNIIRQWGPRRTLVLCGPGNNGGDGYVIADELRKAGWEISVASMRPPLSPGNPTHSPVDAEKAARAWRGPTENLGAIQLDGFGLIVDALFGAGLNRELDEATKQLLTRAAEANVPIVAVDLPTGVNGDTGALMGGALKANLTITFFRKKLGHCLLPGALLCGETRVADIGVREEVLDNIKPLATENAADLWLADFPFPKPEGHKYGRGHALVYGGELMTGATRLGARAAQRIGAGLVTLASPEAARHIYAESLESVIVLPADDLEGWLALLNDPKRNAVLIGPGLGTGRAQQQLVLAALDCGKTCVLDADALTNFASDPSVFLSKLHEKCILTPHTGEFDRLFGHQVDRKADKLTRARAAAEISGCVVLLKGADTVIAAPDGRAVINRNAPPWLATAGSGDVLAGLLLGLVAQNMAHFDAAAAAAWIHGHIAMGFGPGLIAEDLVAGIPAALKHLSQPPGIV
ncbi:MAG: NAD(P)H-hydrate dehydratase [Pseudomonadota bacterium]|nr:NAD(P)H-hydrate dehydratase [Pseudomonadota bacterium]